MDRQRLKKECQRKRDQEKVRKKDRVRGKRKQVLTEWGKGKKIKSSGIKKPQP